MVSVSEQFHTAVMQNSPTTRILFRFADGTLFTNEDIRLTTGVKFTEAANLEEELTIGTCLSSTIETNVLNYHGLLTGYAFGESDVLLAVRTARTTGTAITANTTITLRYGGESPVVITGHSTTPYLRVNGEGTTAQPSFAVKAIFSEGYDVYCVGENGELWAATWADGATWSSLATETWTGISTSTWDDIQGSFTEFTPDTPNDFMTAKFVRWARDGRGLAYNAETLYEFYPNGTVETYEYAKLGTFLIETPKTRKTTIISFTAYDRMTLFDVSADSYLAGLTYPKTLGEIYSGLCTYVGVTSATTTFINSTRSFDAAPMETENVTCREVLAWIAEAACSFARMTRDGELELAWFGTESVELLQTNQFTAEIAEYTVAAVDKLQIKNTENDIGVIIGTGTNGYIIFDNPFLYGDTDTEIRTYGTPIYNRLAAFAAFNPLTASAVCDWSIQAGDIISLNDGTTVWSFPIYNQTITWRGGARVAYESTGSATRPELSAVNRRVFNQNRSIHEIITTVDTLTSRITDAEGNISSVEQYAESLTLSVTNGSTSSVVKLLAGSTEISSQTISMSGLVTFTNLSTAGQTTINGGNITTGTISADRVAAGTFVTYSNLTDGTTTISGNNITTGSISASRISTGTLTSVGIVNSSITLGTSTITFTSASGSIRMNYSSLDKNIIKTTAGAIEIGEYWASEYSAVYLKSAIIGLGDGTSGQAVSVYAPMNVFDDLVLWYDLRHEGDYVGFFGVTPSASRTCAVLDTSATLAMVIAKINEMIGDIEAFGLFNA